MTVSVTEMERMLNPGAVALTKSVFAPAGVVHLVVIVRVERFAVVGSGEKLPVASVGSPLTDKSTEPA